ncbi:MAG TPA: glycosyltransferase family 2 protein [Blastocatellia bacterium]|nr:glycosyltransferase family 2 protein [Blastocatellia bacterium]
MTSLSVVIPAYNEEANIKSSLDEVSAVAQALGIEHEIILVNDGSTDRTGEVARALTDRIPNLRVVEHYPNRGYGGALKAGFAAASKELITFFPSDKQFDFNEVEQLLARVNEADIVCGYRANRRDNIIRKLNAFGWKMVVRLLFGRLCRDIDCGFKVFRRSVLSQVNVVSNGAMIDTELLAGARARGFNIAEEPLTHLPRVAGEATGANLVVIVKAFRDLVRFWLRLNHEIREEKQAYQNRLAMRF